MANGSQNVPYDGYPAPGATAIRLDWKGDHFGPANYQQGGYNLNASALGMAGIEDISPSAFSQSGNFFARFFYPANASNINEQRAIPAPYVTVKWYYAANSVEIPSNNNAVQNEPIRIRAQGI